MGEVERRIMHYSSNQKILLAGEGDFSFSACLATAFGSATKIFATSLDSKESLLRKYAQAERHLKHLEVLGCTVVHEVDAGSMSQHLLLGLESFDRIASTSHMLVLTSESETMFKSFLRNAKEMLAEDGEIHITHKTLYPFSEWNIEKLAARVGLIRMERAYFRKRDYPGYENKRGDGPDSDATFHIGSCSTFKFAKYFLYNGASFEL